VTGRPWRVGIYDRWLGTMGGGEKHAGAIAAVLAEQHSVEFLTHEPVDLPQLATYLGLDLRRVGLRLVPDRPGFAGVIAASADYDLFVNASHFDYFAPEARRNALIVFFPATSVEAATALGAYNRVKRAVRLGLGPILGERLRGMLRVFMFGQTGRSSDQTLLGRAALAGFRLATQPRQQSDVLDAYQHILAISKFTRHWIHTYWDRDSTVLYPEIAVDELHPLTKMPWVLSVGRFFAGSHNKKQVELIRAFRQAVTGPLAGWQLHLAGGYVPSESNAAYLAAAHDAAAGSSAIYLHPNCDAAELRQLYGRSKLFWHATGLGESEAAHPERFEHFGITTVEAMAAGCVPLVIARGGQPEIVHSGVDGYLWTTLDELISRSASLAGDDAEREDLARAAILRARDFGPAAFRTGLVRALALPEDSHGGD
jgi:glycosyltransferase involved in cell wall biosynthesis